MVCHGYSFTSSDSNNASCILHVNLLVGIGIEAFVASTVWNSAGLRSSGLFEVLHKLNSILCMGIWHIFAS